MSDRAPSATASPRPRRGPASSRVTDRDRRLLAFVAEHRIVLAAHVQALLGVSESVAYRRLRALTKTGLLEYSRVLHDAPGWYQISRGGLAMIGSELPAPRVDLRCYQHDLGVAWLWLAASRGALGRAERIVSEREMRSRDARPDAGEAKFGVPLGGLGPRGQPRLHYPDLLLVGGAGERVAVEVELSSKGNRRLETILAAYGADPRIAAVLYLSDKPAIRREVRATAARLGISDLVRVQPVAWPSPTPASRDSGRVLARTRTGDRLVARTRSGERALARAGTADREALGR